MERSRSSGTLWALGALKMCKEKFNSNALERGNTLTEASSLPADSCCVVSRWSWVKAEEEGAGLRLQRAGCVGL